MFNILQHYTLYFLNMQYNILRAHAIKYLWDFIMYRINKKNFFLAFLKIIIDSEHNESWYTYVYSCAIQVIIADSYRLLSTMIRMFPILPIQNVLSCVLISTTITLQLFHEKQIFLCYYRIDNHDEFTIYTYMYIYIYRMFCIH